MGVLGLILNAPQLQPQTPQLLSLSLLAPLSPSPQLALAKMVVPMLIQNVDFLVDANPTQERPMRLARHFLNSAITMESPVRLETPVLRNRMRQTAHQYCRPMARNFANGTQQILHALH